MPVSSRPNPAAIVVENLAPLIGVLAFGWSVAPVMVVYWIENGLRGLETAARMLLARGGAGGVSPSARRATRWEEVARRSPRPPEGIAGPDSPASAGGSTAPAGAGGPASSGEIGPAGRIGLVAFFLVHYGLFWAVHGVFVFLLFVVRVPGPMGGLGVAGGSGLPAGEIALAVALIAAALTASFVRESLAGEPRDRSRPVGLMIRAYGRVMVLHVALLVGGFALLLLGSPTPALILLIGLKMAAELVAARLDVRADPA